MEPEPFWDYQWGLGITKSDQMDTRISADPGYSGHRGDTPAMESSTNGVVQQQQRELITLCFVSTRPVDAAAAVAHAALLLLHLRFGFRKNVLLPLFRRHTRNCHTTAHTAVVLLPLSPATHTPNLSLTPPIYTNHQQPVSMWLVVLLPLVTSELTGLQREAERLPSLWEK